MLFASDLDKTLIYSKGFLDQYKGREKKTLLIEKKDNKEISFISESTANLLKELFNKMLFVPVTTRTIEQYKRISLFQNVVVPKYVIVSNGGNILINGNIDSYWSDFIASEIRSESTSLKDVLKKFDDIKNEEWVLRQREADELYCYFIINDNKIPINEIADFKKWLFKNGWNISIQGRKLYLVPDCINKAKAVNYIKEKSKEDKIIASGDSLLDLCMLESADIAICPSHGEIYDLYKNGLLSVSENIVFTKNKGLIASEEILKLVESFVSGTACCR